MIAPEKSFEQFLAEIGVTGSLLETSTGDTTWDSRLISLGQIDRVLIERYGDGQKLNIATDCGKWSTTGEWVSATEPVSVLINGKVRKLKTVHWDPQREEYVVSMKPAYSYSSETDEEKTVTELRTAISGDGNGLDSYQPARLLEAENSKRRFRRWIGRLAIKG